ncbi:acetyl-CoA carboxylase biotin carboxyl carrier protein subunit [Maribacter chungangensis]|uniref:Acetyl-CoA carboxylase biotin carboxyl carrier protein subunit n=1 Tax=Maribacter chungangensis TaxID=1069117 RepID=A0ABW3AYI8_9FLAO
MEKYLVKIKDTEFEVGNDDLKVLDIQKKLGNRYHVLKNNIAYNVHILETDFESKTLKLSVNGNTYTIAIKDKYDQLVEQMGLLSNTTNKVKNILAPMPGLILNVLVEAGQEIQDGTPLLVLSAMKMENQLLAQGAGIVKAIHLKTGDTVDKGQLIIEIE